MSIVPSLYDAECRICFDSYSTLYDPMLSPCLCRGTSKWVHKSCIQHWREVNLGNEYFFICNTCRHEYSVRKVYPDEDYIIENFINDNSVRAYCAFSAVSFCLAAFIRPMDKYTGFKLLHFASAFERPSYKLKDFFEKNEFYSLEFYYCFIIFAISLLIYLGTFVNINIHTKRRCRYLKYGGLQHVSHLCLSSHFIFFIFICSGDIENLEGVLSIETVLSSANVMFIGNMIKEHNKVIHRLNVKNVGEIQNIEIVPV